MFFYAVVPSVTQALTHILLIILYFYRKPIRHLAIPLPYTLLKARDRWKEQRAKKSSYENQRRNKIIFAQRDMLFLS